MNSFATKDFVLNQHKEKTIFILFNLKFDL